MVTSGKKAVGIVGGGILGLTLALRLSEAGYSVTVLEKDKRIGGLLQPVRIGNYLWDQFYHVILLSDFHTLGLLRTLNLSAEVRWGPAKTGFFTDGKLYSMSNIFEFLSFPPLSLIDKLRLGMTIFYASRIQSPQRLEGERVEDWLTRLSGRRTFEKIWLPLLQSKLGDDYRITNASFIWACIDRMYKARRSGLKQEMFGYVHGGYDRVLRTLDHVFAEKGVRVFCGSEVRRIGRNGDAVRCHSDGATFDFDAVIITLPGGNIPLLVPDLTEKEKERLNGMTYEGVICPTLLLKKPLAGYYVTNITAGRQPFTGVIEMTALVDRTYFDGYSLVYLPRYLSKEDPQWSKSDGEIMDEYCAALGTLYPSVTKDDVVDFVVSRATDVMPIPTLHYSRDLMPPTTTSVRNVYIVNAGQIANGTMNLNEVTGLAEKKALEIGTYLHER